jgi:GH35 family endo-1,4-beta-xylanase
LSQRHHLRVLLVLILAIPFSSYAASSAKAASPEQAASIPTYQWQFQSYWEKAAVNASVKVIMSQRMKNVTLNIADASGTPYTGTVRVTQNSTSFIHFAGWPDLWPEYLALSPSRSFTFGGGAAWHLWEPVRGTFDFSKLDDAWSMATEHGLVDFHLNIGPSFQCCDGTCDGCWIPAWAKGLDYDSLKSAIREYDEALVSHFKGRVQYYELWWEVNGGPWANMGRPLEQIIGIIKTEALTIRSIDPSARICVDLVDLVEHSGGNSWTVEDFVRQLLAAGVPFDIIGIETEYANYLRGAGVDTLYNRLNAIATFGKPIYVWEDSLGSSGGPECDRPETWHGTPPSEEKQAEYMVAETLVYLANPLVLGVHWVALEDALSDQCGTGVIRTPTGPLLLQRRKSFYALEQLWNSLMVNETVQSVNGVATFRGLAGNYSISTEGYEPSVIHVSEGKQNTFPLVLRSLALREQASQMLMKLGSNLIPTFTNPGEIFTIYHSPDARNLLNQSYGEYLVAEQMFRSKDYAGALQHAQKAQDLYNQAQLVENQYRQQQSPVTANRTTSAPPITANRTTTAPIENPVLIAAGALGIAIVLAAIILKRRKSPSQNQSVGRER